MRKICYHVAASLDGFIAGPDGSADSFLAEGDHVDAYLKSLESYDTVIMGRRTYEFGYEFGLTPGERAYPNMEHWIFSRTLAVTPASGVHIVRDNWLEKIDNLRAMDGPPIYLCGGSVFAGWLLRESRIDALIIKLNPVVFGAGLPLFSGAEYRPENYDLLSAKEFKSGVLELHYTKKTVSI